jgi:uncharacterized membrane protein
MPEEHEPPRRAMPMVGVTLAIGAGVGAALFAATQEPWWIGIGAGVGVALDAALDAVRARR